MMVEIPSATIPTRAASHAELVLVAFVLSVPRHGETIALRHEVEREACGSSGGDAT